MGAGGERGARVRHPHSRPSPLLAFAPFALTGLLPPPAAGRTRPWRRPVEGPVARHFRWVPGVYTAGWHRGVTFAASPGTPVLAPCHGRVAFSGTVGSSGRVVALACRRYRAT